MANAGGDSSIIQGFPPKNQSYTYYAKIKSRFLVFWGNNTGSAVVFTIIPLAEGPKLSGTRPGLIDGAEQGREEDTDCAT